MRILHLSDFHFKASAKDQAGQIILVNKLLNSLEDKKNIDFFLFTGDLVFSGTKSENFKDAYKKFLEPIAKKIGITKRNILICPGNHDVDRSKISEPIKDFIRAINDSEKIDQLVKDNKPDVFGLSCKPTENYYKFEKEFYTAGEALEIDLVNKLYSIHIRPISGVNIGFVSINTAWCSTGNDDRGNLFYPLSELEQAIHILNEKKVTWKVLLLHHPLSDLRSFNKLEIEDIIYDEFHFLFSGHLHKREDFLRLTQNEGLFGTHAHAAFTKKQDGKIGYSILDFDLETLEVNIQKYTYDYDEKVFFQLKDMSLSFPCNETKKEQIKIFKTLKRRVVEVSDRANEICITTKENNSSNKGFLDLFVDPVLKKEPQAQAISHLSRSSKVELKSLLGETNYIILGKDKTGKTSLLYKLQLELLINFSQFGEIPIYFDILDHKANPKKFDLIKIISRFLEQTPSRTEEILKKYKIRLLIDNFDPSDQPILNHLSEFINVHNNCKYIIVSDQTLIQSYEKIDYGFDGYNKLFIHDISKREIRELTKKWPNIPKSKQDDFVDRIVEVLKEHSMPFNFWTLSIFLWIFSGKNTLNFNNNSELLELYIDDILDRNKLASDPQNRFSYSNYKLLLSELAYELLINKREYNYSIKYADFTTFVEKFKSQNIRRVGKTSEIIEHLLKRGVIKKLDEDYITFRLNGVFEYFLAFNLIENSDFLKRITADDSVYLSFKNEFEIYSGFARSENDNKELLNLIYKKTKDAFKDLNERMIGSVDDLLINSLQDEAQIELGIALSSVANSSSELNPLTYEEKDDLFDEMNGSIFRDVEVRPKKIYDASLKNFDILERYLIINGRVFKNIDNIKDAKLINQVFDFILESSCNLGFLLLEELESGLDIKRITEIGFSTPKKILLHIITNYLPSVVQTFIYDSIGHINFEEVILAKIDELSRTEQKEQYKIFILYCLLLDIDFKKYKSKIDKLIDISKMGVIKSSIVLKLFYILLFKAYDDDALIYFLKERIRRLNKELNPQVNMKDFDKKFERTKKLLILKRNEK